MEKSITPTISLDIQHIKPETSAQYLKELEDVLKSYGNKHVTNMHIKGNGSKYLYVYNTEPCLVVRVSDHPTGFEGAKTVKTKNSLIAEAIRLFSKIK